MKIGPCYTYEWCDFILWSPAAENISLKIISPEEKIGPMEKDECDYWKVSENFHWVKKDEIPGPSSEETFLKSKLNWNLINDGKHKIMLAYYKSLIKFRKKNLLTGNKINHEVIDSDHPDIFGLRRRGKHKNYFILFNFASEAVTARVPVPGGNWKKIFDSADEVWDGPGASTPEKLLGKNQNITIKKFSLSIYKRKEH
jgi:maltooligosyltrehalose trehalohydrolase